jgi:hypothetical protein
MALSILNTKLFYVKSEQLNSEIIMNKLDYMEFLIYELGKLNNTPTEMENEKDEYVLIENE